MKQINGAEILVKSLIGLSVTHVFGYPGGSVLPIYDQLYAYRDKITHILPSHEQHAAHGADGYARASGKVGVCIATSGPGATNLITGIATAYMDSSPTVFITGNVNQNLIGTDSFQEADIAGMTLPVTKYSFMAQSAGELPQILAQAFYIANSGRKGPVLVDIPKDVMLGTASFSLDDLDYPPASEKVSPPPLDTASIAQAVEILQCAKRVLIYSGGGVTGAGAAEQVKTLAEKLDAGVTSTLMGMGTFPVEDERFLGMVGMHGSRTANEGVSQCDAMIAVGVRFSDRALGDVTNFARGAKIIHIDIDKSEFDKNIYTSVKIVGDAKLILEQIISGLPNKEQTGWYRQIIEQTKHTITEHPAKAIFETIHAVTNGGATIVTDVGQHQMWSAQYYKFSRSRQFLTSGGLGTMGFGLGAAIGAKVAMPQSPTVLITGDGSFRMNLTELSTIEYYNIPVIIVILNNGVLGMVRQWQTLFFGNRYSHTTLDRGPDFVKLAQAYNIWAQCCDTPEDFEVAFAKAFALGKPCLIEYKIDQNEFVVPMVSPGKPITEFVV